MKNVFTAMLILGVISFRLGAIAASREKQDNPEQVVSAVSQVSEEKPAIDEVTPDPNRAKSINLGNGVTMELVLIPSGSFFMGSTPEKAWYGGEGPVQRVRISRPFYMSKYELTQVQWKTMMGTTVLQQLDKVEATLPSPGEGDDYPICYVSWDEAVAFCSKLASGFRLPTEAEWEYACRAGSDTRFHYGADPNCSQLGQYDWYKDNSANSKYPWYEDRSAGSAHDVGQKKPNTWGLYDMHGNVGEWCADRWARDYKGMANVAPTGPSKGMYRVIRGGGWRARPIQCRSAARSPYPQVDRHPFVGFRIVLEAK